MGNNSVTFVLAVSLFIAASQARAFGEYSLYVESEQAQPAEVSVEMGNFRRGPMRVSRNGPHTYGGFPLPLPKVAKVTWAVAGGSISNMEVSFSQVPKEFRTNDGVTFRITSDGSLKVIYSIRVEQFRKLEIPLHETASEARQRELNEALYRSAGLGRIDEVKALVQKGADVNYLENSAGVTPLRLAANGQHYEVVDFLLNNGARIRKRDLASPYLKSKAEGMNPDNNESRK
jgi:hypothetical protein